MKDKDPLFYVTAIAITSIIAVVLLSIFAPDSGSVTDVLGLAGIMAVQILNNRQVTKEIAKVAEVAAATHSEVNSKMTLLLASTKAEGIAEGKESERASVKAES